MNIQSDTSTKQSVEKAYISHVLRYVGVGLISGSIVHTGTLGGDSTQYIVLIAMGVVAFIVGTLLDKRDSESSLTSFIIVSVIMSIGVGMVSGGTQHYLDGPTYAAFLIPIGAAVGYFAFLFRDFKTDITTKRIFVMLLVMFGLIGVLYLIAQRIPIQEDHHSTQTALDGSSSMGIVEKGLYNDSDAHPH